MSPLDEFYANCRRFWRGYKGWVSDSESNFLLMLFFGGIGATVVVLLLAYTNPSLPSYQATDLEYMMYILGAIGGFMGGYIIGRVRQYVNDHPNL